MLNIAIVEDTEADRKLLSEYLDRFSKERNVPLSYQTYPNPIPFLDKYEGNLDVIFFDIKMPQMSGMEAAKKIRAIDSSVIIIFVTSLAQFALEGYSVQALDYLVKPVSYSEFYLKFSRALPRIPKKSEETIIVSTSEGKKVIPIEDLHYVESKGHHLTYHYGNETAIERNTMKDVEKELAGKGFYRINSCYLVHLRDVKKVKGYECQVGEETLMISQPRKKAFLDALKTYLTENV